MRKQGSIRLAGADSTHSTNPGTADYEWAEAEAQRRGCSIAQIVRDAFRAYRKLTPNAVAFDAPPSNKYIPVDF